MTSKKKCLLMISVVFLCLNVSPMIQAELAIVAARVLPGDNESDLLVLHAGDQSFWYDTPNCLGVRYTNLAAGNFKEGLVVPTGQVVVSAYSPNSDALIITSNVQCYAFYQEGALKVGETNPQTGNQYTDIAAAQFDDDDYDEFVVSSYRPDASMRNSIIHGFDSSNFGTNSSLFSSVGGSSTSGIFTAVATGQFDDDPYTEVVATRFSDSEKVSDLWLFQNNGERMNDSNDVDLSCYTDVATGDVDSDQKTEAFVTVDRCDFVDKGYKSSRVYQYRTRDERKRM